MPWRRIYRHLSLAYGWTPQQIGELTLAQITIYMVASPDIGETKAIQPDAAIAFAESKSANKERWMRQVTSFAR